MIELVYSSLFLDIVHDLRAKIWLIGTTHGGKCYHTFSESLECQLSE